jgi:hypothetical protein
LIGQRLCLLAVGICPQADESDGWRAYGDADILCGGLKSLGLDPKFVQGQGSTMENNSVGSC